MCFVLLVDRIRDFVNDHYGEVLQHVQGFLPVGNDMGNVVYYYTEKWEPHGVYISDITPMQDFRRYIGPDLQSLLFDEVSVHRLIKGFSP